MSLYSMIRDAPPQLTLKLYKQLVLPISTYGGEIWGPYELASVRKQEVNILSENTVRRFGCETLQTKFVKEFWASRKGPSTWQPV